MHENHASMEPRSNERGNPRASRARRTRWTLQWSHAQTSVETATWGRPCAARITRFNGATLKRAWKRRLCRTTRPIGRCFNGATLKRAWKRAIGRGSGADASASMEPRSNERGNVRFRMKSGWRGVCFNGATLKRAWKLAAARGYHGMRIEMLQWSHARPYSEIPTR